MALDRRDFVRKTVAGAVGGGALLGTLGVGCNRPKPAGDASGQVPVASPQVAPLLEKTPNSATPGATLEAPAPQCVVPIHQTAGPFFSRERLIRSNLQEDREGAPLTLSFDLVDGERCTPLSGLQVAVWHSDAHGVYGGFDRQGHRRDVDARGKTFLRGTQVSSNGGRVTFSTIVPGWYPNRITHIHLRVIKDKTSLLTTQIYLPDEVIRRVYSKGVYRDHGWRDTEEKDDRVLGRAIVKGAESGRELVRLVMKSQSSAWRAHAVIGVPRRG